MSELGYFEIETRIVDKDHNIGREAHYVLLAKADVAIYFAQMRDDLNDTHICQIPYVAHLDDRGIVGGDLSHTVATPKADLGLGFASQKCPHQIGAVKVARCLSRNDIIFHNSRALVFNNKNTNATNDTNRTTIMVFIVNVLSLRLAIWRSNSNGATKQTANHRKRVSTGIPATRRPTYSNAAARISEPAARIIP